MLYDVLSCLVHIWGLRHVMGYIVFFFFQAEDGIRDLTVTGVQTCALPISHVSAFVSRDDYRWRSWRPLSGSRTQKSRDQRRCLRARPDPQRAFTGLSHPYRDRKSVV